MVTENWYLSTQEGSAGPYTDEDLRGFVEAGSITPEWFVWREGFADWVALGESGALATAEAFAAPLPPPAPFPAAVPATVPSAAAAAPAKAAETEPAFASNPIVFRKAFFTFLGAAFRGFDSSERLVLYSKQKAFKLKEDITVFADEAQTRPLLRILARQILDFSAAYDVTDARSGAKVGALRRKGWSSMVRDAWEILDGSDRAIGKIEEDSMFLALVRRFLVALIPQKFHYKIGEREVATFQQHFNPFLFKGTLDVNGGIDRRLAVAATVLLLAIEGRQR